MPSSSKDHKRDRRRRDDDDDDDDKVARKKRSNDDDDVGSDDDERKEARKSSGNQDRGRDRSSRRSKKHSRHSKSDSEDDDSEDDEERKRSKRRKHKRHSKSSSNRKSKKSRKHKSSSHHRSKKRRKHESSESDDSSSSDDESSSSSSSSSSSDDGGDGKKSKQVNAKLLAKLQARGETLEERKERRAQKRAAKIQARFGYTAEDNPFNDPNLHETFTWTKKKEKAPAAVTEQLDTLQEIDTIRRRRKEREAERDEMERLRAEESRMKELENYDDWARKEEEFHLEQQRKRSAIRLVEGREKPIDILAKNLLLFGLTDEEKNHRAAVKYKERYNALDQLDKLEAELQEPHKIVQVLKLAELKELLMDIDAFRILEREGMSDGDSKHSILLYWDALQVVVLDEIKLLQNGGDESSYAKKVTSIKEIFAGQSKPALLKMGEEIDAKLAKPDDGIIDKAYWGQVKEQLIVHLAKMDLSVLHSKMLVRQLERLEQRKEELARRKREGKDEPADDEAPPSMVPKNVDADFGNREDELGETDEVQLETSSTPYSWQDRYAPRKPRYFNRVKTGYDWNKYNQTHYDHDNPPPKTVQGYKFNIFYPDLVDPTKTPQFFIEPADSNDFCILRFHAGPPYEDVAFKIINREWNRSRKRGFKCSFERGVLSLYFNFTTHWYRR